MCIYCETANYRKIFESHHGKIPYDLTGRRYHIHHKDGNHDNNHPDNLIALSLVEHYEIHLRQGDYGAAQKLAMQLKIDPAEISKLATLANQKRIDAGTHNFLDKAAAKVRAKKLVAEGRCNLVGESNPVHGLIEKGLHHFQDPEFSRKRAKERVLKGTHNFQGGIANLKRIQEGRHSSQIVKICPHCNTSMTAMLYGRYHGDRCRSRIFNTNPTLVELGTKVE